MGESLESLGHKCGLASTFFLLVIVVNCGGHDWLRVTGFLFMAVAAAAVSIALQMLGGKGNVPW